MPRKALKDPVALSTLVEREQLDRLKKVEVPEGERLTKRASLGDKVRHTLRRGLDGSEGEG